MKKIAALLFLVLSSTGFAEAKDWKTAVVIGTSETDVTGPMRQPKNIIHYTVETDDLLLLLDFTYHPEMKAGDSDEPGKNSPPHIPLGEPTKISISGHTAYLLDAGGAEVKMHIKKKSKK